MQMSVNEFFKPGTLFFRKDLGSVLTHHYDVLLLIRPSHASTISYVFLDSDCGLFESSPIVWHSRSWCYIQPNDVERSLTEYSDAYYSVVMDVKVVL